jgi:hypothetical protein
MEWRRLALLRERRLLALFDPEVSRNGSLLFPERKETPFGVVEKEMTKLPNSEAE